MTMLNTNQIILKKLIKLFGKRGLRSYSLTSTIKSQDVPSDSDPPPSFMASEWEAQECLVPTYWHVLGLLARREDLGSQVIAGIMALPEVHLSFSQFFSVIPGRPLLKVYR